MRTHRSPFRPVRAGRLGLARLGLAGLGWASSAAGYHAPLQLTVVGVALV